MGIGQILSDTLGAVKRHFGSLLVLWALYFGITIVLFFVMMIVMGVAGVAGVAALGTGDLSAGGSFAAIGGMVVFGLLFYVGYLLVAMAQSASLIVMASPMRQATFNDALGAGWRAAPALLLLVVVLIIGYLVGALAVGAVSAAFSAAADWTGPLLALLTLPVLVWLGCRLAPLFAVVAVDEVRNPVTAIARTWRLTRGHALTILLASVAFIVILLLACGIVLLPSLGLLGSLGDSGGLAQPAAGRALGGFALLFLGMMIASVLFNLCYCAFMAVIHGSLSEAAGEGTAQTFA